MKGQCTQLVGPPFFLLALCVSAVAQSGGTYVIKKSTLDGGGATVSGGAYRLTGTVGQHDAGPASGGDYVLSGGFWSPIAPAAPPATPLWDCPGGDLGNSLCAARTRGLTFTVEPPAAATGGEGTSAISVTMIELQNPNPPNNGCCPPPDFGAYEEATCTAVGEGASCQRWIGPPFTYLEAVDLPSLGNYRASRLQCTPYYHDWVAEAQINLVGAEILPSSTYVVKTYGSDCKGTEDTCANVSADVIMKTRRAGDIATPYAPAAAGQPNALDIANAVNHFKKLPGAPRHIEAQVQANVPDINADVNALDIGAIVDNVKLVAYPYSGPCVCPSTVPCNLTACANAGACTGLYGAGATCIKACSAGPRLGQPCSNNKNCGVCTGGTLPGIPCDNSSQCAGGGTCTSGTCAAGGFCRDRCARCN